MAKKEKDADILKSINWLSEVVSKNQALPLLGNTEIRILAEALQELPASIVLKVKTPDEPAAVNREELKIKLNDWLDGLPNEPVLLNLVS
jgi:DNA polymerase III sliding clamp (beta) subunit (PCNA family)